MYVRQNTTAANEFLHQKYKVNYVDTITEAGPVRILAEEQDSFLTESILNRIDISVNRHKSISISIVTHYDCDGNPLDKTEQMKQLKSAIVFLKEKYQSTDIIGLWIDSEWKVEQVN